MKFLSKFLELRSLVATAEHFKCSTTEVTNQIYVDLSLIDPKGVYPRNLRKLKSLSYIIKSQIRDRDFRMITQSVDKIKKWIMIEHPESIEYLKKYPLDCKLVQDLDSILTIVIPEELWIKNNKK